MKFFTLNNVIRLAIINFFVFFTAAVYLNNQMAKTAPIQPVANPVSSQAEEPKATPTVGTQEKITATPTEAPQETIWQEAAKHNSKSDCWIVYGNHIYNITSYFGSHPGGDAVMDKYCGKDATTAFDTQDKNPPSPHSANAASILSQFLVK